MSLFTEYSPDAIFFSRSDVNEPLGTFSHYGFELDDFYWPSVEHYYQGMKFENLEHRALVQQADHPLKARKIGRSWRKKLRKDWRSVREVIMTRAVYTRCKTHPELASLLLDTGDRSLVENSQYDYFWGCGRDRRGENTYGKVLMKVRAKLLSENTEV